MGNQPSKDVFIDHANSKKISIRSSKSLVKSGNCQQLENNRVQQSTKTSRLLQRRTHSSNNSSSLVVSPVRHQLVLTDHVTPLVSLSVASNSGIYQRRFSGKDTRSMSSTSITSEEGEPNTPTFHHRSSCDEYSPSYMSQQNENQHTNKLSSSLPSKHTDDFMIDLPFSTWTSLSSQRKSTSNRKRDSRELWVYEYGAEKERDRQTRQHYVLKQVFEGNIHVQLNEPKRILDSACGVGLWSLEMAQEYPNCQVIGIDVVPPSEKEGWNLIPKNTLNSAGQTTKTNVHFQYGDILKPSLLFPDHHFDLVYQRDVATVLPFDLWPNLLREFYRITKPGGQIQLVEYNLLFKKPGPILTLINEWYRTAASTIGVEPDYTDYLYGFLKEAGFVDIEEKVVDIPIGEWPTTELAKQHGYLYKEQMRALFKSMKRWWCTEIKVSQQEYDRVCIEALDEFDEFHSLARWNIFTATKPMN